MKNNRETRSTTEQVGDSQGACDAATKLSVGSRCTVHENRVQ